MPSITVPRSFFVSERNNVYSNWPSAFWREFLSNSLDAGARRILLRTRFAADGAFVVDVVDDGCGMDRRTVDSVYMSLGASTKTGEEGAIGGYGRARLLTCFSHRAYRIRTRDILVTGEGGDYEIQAQDRVVAGTAIRVETDPEHAFRLTRDLRQVLRQSRLRAAVTLDLASAQPEGRSLALFAENETAPVPGRPEQRAFAAWAPTGRVFERLSDERGEWAVLRVRRADSEDGHRSLVRVGGLAMHEDYIAAPVQVCVELDPARSREVLTASRDSIRGAYRDRLAEIHARIAVDRASTFRRKPAEPQSWIDASRGRDRGAPMPRGRKTRLETEVSPERDDLAAAMLAPAARPARPTAGAPLAASRPAAPEPAPEPKAALLHPVAFHLRSPTTGQRAALRRLKPETWVAGTGEGRSAELLHAAWTAACRHALEILADLHPQIAADPSRRFVTGFVVDADLGGCHMAFDDIRHGLLVNPLDDGGRLRYALADPADLRRLAAVAVHEVAHVLHDWHDEGYANLLTDLTGEIDPARLLREMRAEMSRAAELIAARRNGPAEPDPTPAPRETDEAPEPC